MAYGYPSIKLLRRLPSPARDDFERSLRERTDIELKPDEDGDQITPCVIEEVEGGSVEAYKPNRSAKLPKALSSTLSI